MTLTLKFYLTDEAKAVGLSPPARAYDSDAGFDLRALHPYRLPPLSVVQIQTGVGFEIPEGWYGLICNRTSGGLRGLLPVGHVVDTGYTGEIILLMYNTRPDTTIEIERNEKVAQIVFMPTFQGEVVEIRRDEVKPTERGGRRLGSSGRT